MSGTQVPKAGPRMGTHSPSWAGRLPGGWCLSCVLSNEPKTGGKVAPRKPESGVNQGPDRPLAELRMPSEEGQAAQRSREALCQAEGLGFYSESNWQGGYKWVGN